MSCACLCCYECARYAKLKMTESVAVEKQQQQTGAVTLYINISRKLRADLLTNTFMLMVSKPRDHLIGKQSFTETLY